MVTHPAPKSNRAVIVFAHGSVVLFICGVEIAACSGSPFNLAAMDFATGRGIAADISGAINAVTGLCIRADIAAGDAVTGGNTALHFAAGDTIPSFYIAVPGQYTENADLTSSTAP